MKLSHIIALTAIATVPALAGCSSDNATPGTSDVVQAKSDLQRNTTPQVPAADRIELSRGNASFAFAIYHQLAKGNQDNLFLSPTSMSLALAMTYAGASGDTATQMAKAMGFTLPPKRLHAAFNDLDLKLASRGNKPVDDDKDALKLHVANAMWLQDGFPFQKPFLDTLAVNYGAGLNLLDFAADPSGSRQLINNWVANKTEQKIKDLLPPDSIDSMTRFVIANAIYFKGSWQDEFDKNSTQNGTFHAPGGDVTVPMMHQGEPSYAPYAQADGFQAVKLAYAGGEADMTIVLPDQGSFASIESQLSPQWLGSVDAKMKANTKPVHVTMPKFSFTYKKDLAEGTLQALGMTDAFIGGKADFSGMDGRRDLYISGVFHKAFIGVDEDGTEAAAATAVVGRQSSAIPDEPVRFVADRPFIVLIRDIETGAVLFEGRVMDPSSK